MAGAVARAEELRARQIPTRCIPAQFDNPANPLVHEKTTAEEIWHDTGGNVDALVIGVGTGGTLTGVGRALKPRRPGLKIIAVEPSAARCCPAAQRGRTRSRASAPASCRPSWTGR